MSQNHVPQPQADPDLDAGIDPEDPAIAWNFGTRELTPDEYAKFADYTRRDLNRVEASREADAAYAEWKATNPEAAARAEADFHAAGRAACPLLYGVATPEVERMIHEAGGWFGYEADRAPGPEPEPEPEAELSLARTISSLPILSETVRFSILPVRRAEHLFGALEPVIP